MVHASKVAPRAARPITPAPRFARVFGLSLALVSTAGLFPACRKASPPPTPPPTTAAPEAEAAEATPDEAAPTPSPSIDPLTQLRWQAQAKGEGQGGSETGTPNGESAATPPPATDAGVPMHHEKAERKTFWQEKVDEARTAFESARAARPAQCPEPKPGEKRPQEEQSYCDDLERAERLAREKYDVVRQGAAREGFSLR